MSPLVHKLTTSVTAVWDVTVIVHGLMAAGRRCDPVAVA